MDSSEKATLLAVLMSFECLVSVALARYLPQWFDDIGEVVGRADLVVVGSPTNSVPCGMATNRMTAEVYPPSDPSKPPSERTFEYPRGVNVLIPTETEFAVLAVLKGTLEGDSLSMFHYGWDSRVARRNPMCELNMPNLVSFESVASVDASARSISEKPLRYLLCLRLTNDGRWIAATGQYDAAYAVQLLTPVVRGRGVIH